MTLMVSYVPHSISLTCMHFNIVITCVVCNIIHYDLFSNHYHAVKRATAIVVEHETLFIKSIMLLRPN